ncbi:hypothetical protein [Desulfatirhabdium butyrativorans]|uniref:hypothetical protein n=1 Tax=Desulfatirhabdium butyrativorans TaxID=340467 RepID=UPI0003FDF93E|nr:hypothetical protein [Desulfatirhabdium butyrativorans]
MAFTMKLNEFEEAFSAGFSYMGADQHDSIFEAAADGSGDDFVAKQIKSQAMSCLLTWIDAGDFSVDALDACVIGIADMDGNEEISPDEEAYYNDLWAGVADAMLSFGADSDTIDKFINDDDDASGEKLGSFISEKLNATETPDGDLISNYVLGADDAVMESTIRVVRGGQVVKIRRKFRHKRITSAQRMALKQARMKANTSMAKRARAKSMKIRKKRGL